MKCCSRCKLQKNTSDFYVKDSASGRLHTQCKSCYKEHRKTYYRQHYEKYGADYRKRAKTYRDNQRFIFHRQMLEYLSDKSCVVCSESDVRVLEFDHLEPKDKSFSISQAFKLGYKWEDVAIEIKKCRILCANCHKKHTAKQFSWYKDINGGTYRI